MPIPRTVVSRTSALGPGDWVPAAGNVDARRDRLPAGTQSQWPRRSAAGDSRGSVAPAGPRPIAEILAEVLARRGLAAATQQAATAPLIDEAAIGTPAWSVV